MFYIPIKLYFIIFFTNKFLKPHQKIQLPHFKNINYKSNYLLSHFIPTLLRSSHIQHFFHRLVFSIQSMQAHYEYILRALSTYVMKFIWVYGRKNQIKNPLICVKIKFYTHLTSYTLCVCVSIKNIYNHAIITFWRLCNNIHVNDIRKCPLKCSL